MTQTDTRGYRQNVGAILIRNNGDILLGERIRPAGIFQFPQGGVDPGESPEEAIWRELTEELGLSSPEKHCTLLAVGPPTRYDFAPNYDAPIAKRYRGQEQTLFVFSFEGDDSDFALDAFHQPEFCSILWLAPEQALQTFWSFKREPFIATWKALPDIFGPLPFSS